MTGNGSGGEGLEQYDCENGAQFCTMKRPFHESPKLTGTLERKITTGQGGGEGRGGQSAGQQ